jgi:metal-responsive CopG/Arc/MetJ family transcriptional regulator
MATTMRRFTISVTPDLDAELDVVKKECYYKNNQNDMIRDLIARGLQTLRSENLSQEGAAGNEKSEVYYTA